VRLATWNVNSLRVRLDRVLAWLEAAEVDVLAIQETKVADTAFPAMPFAQGGYEVAYHGLGSLNGVAIASRVGLADVQVGFPGMPTWGEDPPVAEARAIGADCGGVRVWSLYVPNGRALDHPHYEYKLKWLAALADAGRGWLAGTPDLAAVLCGDFNIAPTDDDVWDPAFFEDKTHTSPRERAAFDAVTAAGYADLVRPHAPGPGVYTYWDYQQLRFPRREGMRIDFLLGTPAVERRVAGAHIARDQRKGKGPSDHAPVVVDLDGVAVTRTTDPGAVRPADSPS
jgi:exodeoxyribonuclease-3